MELPIDHFHLLGVPPTTDAQSVLRTLQQRLDRSPDQGFSLETLQARAELLRNSADLLSDEQRRRAYEAQLLGIHAASGSNQIAALEIPASRDVAGLLLMLEAGLAQEAFETARRNLQPPQAPALGSSREADLTLLAGLACQAAALDYQDQRRFEAAATVLQQGLQLLQRMGQLPQQRRQLEQQLGRLLPYRVLDLVSRDLGATLERSEGLKLLEELVQRRGGLDGDGDRDFDQGKFQTFFKQIRPFLTVQEQVDLFSRWAQAGSATADFLASYALTASGFAQRKPERIREAYGRLSAAGQLGIEPFLACQQLLLGQVEQAESHFDQGASAELRQWASEQGSESLERLCAYCRDWLAREVLPGYRDMEVDADLDAWFADRDVQTYVEQQDRRSGRQAPASGRQQASAPSATAESGLSAASLDGPQPAPWNAPWLESPSPGPGVPGADDTREYPQSDGSGGPWAQLGLPQLRWPPIGWPDLLQPASAWAANWSSDWNHGSRPRLKLRQRLGSGWAKAKAAKADLAARQPGRLGLGELASVPHRLRSLLPPWRRAGDGAAPGAMAPAIEAQGEPTYSLAPLSWPELPNPQAEPSPAAVLPFGPLSGSEALGAPHPPTPGVLYPDPRPAAAWPLPLVATVAGVALAGLGLGGWLALRPKPERAIPLPVQPLTSQPASLATPKPKPPQPELPLQAPEPSEAQLQRLLEAWFQAKAAVLAGQAPALPPSQLAVASLVAALDQDRQADLDRGETQTVSAKVTSLEIGSRSPERIEAKVTLRYGDLRRSQAGKLLEETPEGERQNTYVFGRNQKSWKLERVIFQAS